MEKQPEANNRVQITKAVFDGLEFIRRSGATNMLDRPMVLHLAREWEFTETADWIESVDTGTYGRLIFQGPEVIKDEPTNQATERELTHQAIENDLTNHVVENDAVSDDNVIDAFNRVMDDEKATMRNVISKLGKQASLAIADTYETELMGVLIDSPRLPTINVERNALIRNLAEASNLWLQLEETMSEIQRGIESLQNMIDPENN